jgi:hypothetical protein
MSDTDREMSLEECLQRLPEFHRARKELAKLISDSTQLADIYTFAEGWFSDECQNAADVANVWNKTLKQAEETALIIAGVKPLQMHTPLKMTPEQPCKHTEPQEICCVYDCYITPCPVCNGHIIRGVVYEEE